MGLRTPPDCGEVYPLLWVGETPLDGQWLLRMRFNVLVLCAYEIQPPDAMYPMLEVVRCPIDDDELSPRGVAMVRRKAQLVARRVRDGHQTLSACHQGLNRSALVAGLAMVGLGVPPKEAIARIREVRGPWALSNVYFERMILRR